MAKKLNPKPIPKPAPAKQPVKPANTPAVKIKKPVNWFSVNYLCIFLAVVSFVIYANTLAGGYALDDVMMIKDNQFVKQGFKAIPELLSTPHMRGYLVIPNDLYRPLSLVMFAIEYQVFGPIPAAGHLFNVLVFAGCVVFLFLFLNKFFNGEKTSIAFIAALLFAVHPIHTEVVANIKSRDELLCFFFAFWSLNVFMNYMKAGKMLQLLLGALLFFLSCISKETVITFLVVIPVLFFLYYNENKRRAVYIIGGVIAATAVFLLIRTIVLTTYHANEPSATTDFMDNALVKAPDVAQKIATEFFILGKYLQLMFVPYPLLCNYSYNSIPFVGFGNVWVLLSIAAYGFMACFCIVRLIKNKKDPWAFAILVYLASISLFSNLPFLMGAEMAERFAFFASTGFCIAGALAVEQWIIKARAKDTTVLKSVNVLLVLVPVFLIFSSMTISRNSDWRDEYILYKTDLEKSPNDARLHQYVATALAETKYFEETDTLKQKAMDNESVTLLKEALRLYPNFAQAHVELGRVYDRQRLFTLAEDEDIKALTLDPTSSTANNNIASVYISTGRYRQAIPHLIKSIAVNPNFKFAYLNLANSYMQVRSYDSAIINYKLMLAFDPTYSDAYQQMATAYFQKQDYDSAALYFKRITELKPNDPNAYNNLGAAYLNAKKYPLAIEQFNKTLSLNPNFLSAYANLGKSYYTSGQYETAINIFNKELSLNPRNPSDIPYIALSYQKLGKMEQARQYEAIAKKYYSNFKLE